MLLSAIPSARTRALRPYVALVALGGFSLAIGLGLELGRHLRFEYRDDSGIVGWLHVHAYPKQQELVYYALALLGPPLVMGLGWLGWIAYAGRVAAWTRRPVEHALKRSALAALPMLLVWPGIQRLDRSAAAGLGAPLVLGVVVLALAAVPTRGGARSPVAEPRSALRRREPSPPRSRARSLLRTGVEYLVLPAFLYFGLLNGDIHGKIDLFHEGERLAPLNALLHGGVPFRDVYLQHGLFQDAYMGRVASALFGPTLEGMRTLKRLLEPLGPIALYLLGLQVFRGRLLTAAILVWIVAGRHVGVSERQALGLIALVLVAGYVNRRSLARAAQHEGQRSREDWLLVLAGLTSSAAFWYSTEVGLYALAAIGAFLLLYGTWSPGGGIRQSLRMLACTGAGVALGLGLVGVHLAAHGALDDALENTYIQVAYQMEIWGRAFPSLGSVLEPLNDLGLATGWRTFVLSEGFRWYLPILVLMSAGAYLTLRLLRGDLWPSEGCVKLLLLFLAGAVFFRTALGRSDALHMDFGAATAWLLLLFFVERGIGRALDELRARGIPWQARARSALVHAWVLVPALGLAWYALAVHHPAADPPRGLRWSALFAGPWIAPAERPTSLARAGRIDIPAAQEREIREVVEYVRANTAEGEAIFDFSNQGGYFFFADRPSATRYFQVVYASTPAQQQEVIDALERSKTRTVIYRTESYAQHFDGVDNEQRLPRIAAYLARHYEPAASFGGTELWRRRP
jgi:hypothetical protein